MNYQRIQHYQNMARARVVLSLFFVALLCGTGCSSSSNDGRDPSSDKSQTRSDEQAEDANTKGVTVICKCGKGKLSWTEETKQKAEEQAKKNCSALSQSLKQCKIKQN